MKKQRKVEKDNRGVAIYARKSRITNKGDSIGVQFKQCADYAKKELGLDEEYEFLQYEDKGLSGYFSDRPDFQKMLHDVQDGKIKAIVCYKLDRVGRKTADLIRLMDFLEMYHVDLLICSNGINTASGLYKIFIQIFAVIAEFERDTLTERIVDNMMELAKDGRWLGGNTPMGFTVRRVTTGSGKGKSAYSYLESLLEEKRMVQRLYEIFRTTRSIQTTAKQMNEEGFHTPSGAAFNASTTRLVLRNPIYCTADKRSYDYFIDHDGNVFGDMTEFDGTHGLSAYNKTDQEKYEGSDSTFISPKYVQTIESKPVSEWIIAVGKHEGFIPSEQWVEVQELLDAIAEKYNRPHRKTNALLAGLVHCPHCGRRLSVISESDRWTNGKPRFKYVCPGYRKKECNFKAVDGVLLDEFVVQQLSDLSDENSERFKDILEIKIEEVLEKSQTVQEHTFIKKKRDKLKADIAAQTRNLREADGSIKQFIQEDLQNLAMELRETERQLSKLDEGRKNNMIAIRDLEMTKERLLSFAEYAKDAQPEVLVTLIQTIVERIYIVDKDDERFCHIFIKGCTDEDYTGFFQTAGYIEQKTTPVCDSEQYCINNNITPARGKVLIRHTLSKIDGQLRMDVAPVLPPTRPLFCNIHHRQIQHFQQTVICRENALGFCDLPQLPIKAFNRVRGIDQTADFLRIFEVGAEVSPVFPPRLCNLGIFIVPVLRESLQSVQSSLFVHCCIHGFQIGHESLQVFVRNVFAGIPQLVNHAVLNLRFREHRMDGCIETSQIVCTCDKNILYAPIPQTIQYGRPKLCALILADPHAQNIFATVQIKADGNVYCFLYNLPFTTNMVVDRIQKNYGIDRFQRPLLPFFRHRQDLIRDPAYRSVRHRQPVDILNMRLDVAGRHAFRIHVQDLLFDILTDAGLVLFQKLRFKFTPPVTGNRNLDLAETGPQILLLWPFRLLSVALFF